MPDVVTTSTSELRACDVHDFSDYFLMQLQVQVPAQRTVETSQREVFLVEK